MLLDSISFSIFWDIKSRIIEINKDIKEIITHDPFGTLSRIKIILIIEYKDKKKNNWEIISIRAENCKFEYLSFILIFL